MGTPEATGAIVPPEVSPELLEPLVTVVAILGELGATAGDVPLPGPPGSLRAGLVALVATISRAMGHRHGDATRLRRALATAGTPPGDPAVPRATAGDAWASAAAVTREWREAVAMAEATWASAARDAERLRDACGTAATAGATAEATKGHLAAAVAREDGARRELLAAARALPVASDVATVAEAVTIHGIRVAEAEAGLGAASEATEAAAVALVEAAVAGDRGQRAAVAREPLGRLVTACHGATSFYRHLRCRLQDIEATVAACGGLEVARVAPGVPKATVAVPGGPGVPEDLVAAVAAAEALWDASARLAKGHLLGTLRAVRGLLVTLGVPDVTAVTRRCQEATAALPGLLPRGPP